MLRRNDRVLSAQLHHQLLRTGVYSRVRADVHDRLRAGIYNRVCADIHDCLRSRLHELLLGRLFELLRTSHVYYELRRRLVSGLLGRSSSHTFVGLADGLRRRIPDNLCSGLRTERLLVVPVRLCDQLCSRLLELFELFVVCIALQLVFDLHRWLCSVKPMWFFLRLQLV
jgi:hypothetical protein